MTIKGRHRLAQFRLLCGCQCGESEIRLTLEQRIERNFGFKATLVNHWNLVWFWI